jgi:hypothetical protein
LKGSRRWRGRQVQVGRGNVIEDFRLGGEDFNTEVVGTDVEGQVGLVDYADIGPGVDAFVGDCNHDGEAGGVKDLIVVSIDSRAEAAGVWLAADDVVGEDRFRDAGGNRESSGGEDSCEGELLKERHRGLLR